MVVGGSNDCGEEFATRVMYVFVQSITLLLLLSGQREREREREGNIEKKKVPQLPPFLSRLCFPLVRFCSSLVRAKQPQSKSTQRRNGKAKGGRKERERKRPEMDKVMGEDLTRKQTGRRQALDNPSINPSVYQSIDSAPKRRSRNPEPACLVPCPGDALPPPRISKRRPLPLQREWTWKPSTRAPFALASQLPPSIRGEG